MKKIIVLFSSLLYFSSVLASDIVTYKDACIQYGPVMLTSEEKGVLLKIVEKLNDRYDEKEKMVTRAITSWNYHTDATHGVVYHIVWSSFIYASHLLDLGDDQYSQRAFDIIEKTISLQDTDPQSRSYGVWPYYMEEPLATKKSPVDFNWADFNAVHLLDIYMGHKDRIPASLLSKIETALVLAARSIEKRNVGPGYTNIAIKGTYVTFMVSHLFGLEDMQAYAKERLARFYNYTLEKGGFTEYNSPAYTTVALEELGRMKKHIIEPQSKKMIDYLYTISWEIIARHYHKPTGQWSGPHSRAYSTLAGLSFYQLIKQASSGTINLTEDISTEYYKIKHEIPQHLYHYFLAPQYPRVEKDIFEKVEPSVYGTSYLTDLYTLSSVNRASLWNQRRPVLLYWGTLNNPRFLRPCLLHEFYDFSAASIYTQQEKNRIIAAINFTTNGGDKHISIDRLKEGKFKAKDLRLRFEIGNYSNIDCLSVPSDTNNPISIIIDNLKIDIQLFCNKFGDCGGYWEKGGDRRNIWLDYVIYSGEEKEIDLSQMHEAVLGFALSVDEKDSMRRVESAVQDNVLTARWHDLQIDVPVKPEPAPSNL